MEGVLIQEFRGDFLLNRKGEWGQNLPPRFTTEDQTGGCKQQYRKSKDDDDGDGRKDDGDDKRKRHDDEGEVMMGGDDENVTKCAKRQRMMISDDGTTKRQALRHDMVKTSDFSDSKQPLMGKQVMFDANQPLVKSSIFNKLNTNNLDISTQKQITCYFGIKKSMKSETADMIKACGKQINRTDDFQTASGNCHSNSHNPEDSTCE